MPFRPSKDMSKRKLIYDHLMEDNKRSWTPKAIVDNKNKEYSQCLSNEIVKNQEIKTTISNLDSIIVEEIENLHNNSEFVSVSGIIMALCSKLGVKSLEQIIADSHIKILQSGENIPTLNQHIQLMSKITILIQSYVVSNTITTIADIECMLAEEFNVICFNDLKIGPISKVPLIKRYFNLSQDTGRRFTLTSSHVLHNLKKFSHKFPDKVRDIFSFLDYLCRSYKLTSLTDLGIKIRDYSSLLESLKMVEDRESKFMREESEKLSKNFLVGFENELRSLQKGLDRCEFSSLDPSSKIVQAISNVPLEKFVVSLEIYLKKHEFLPSISNQDSSEMFKSVFEFVRMIRTLISNSKFQTSFLKLPLIYSFFMSLHSLHPGELYEMLKQEGFLTQLPKNSNELFEKFSNKLDSLLNKKDEILLIDLIEFETKEKLMQNGFTCLELISKQNKQKDLILLASSHKNIKKISSSSAVVSMLENWAGYVPEKWAQLQLLRHFNTSLTDLKIDNFHQYYSQFSKKAFNLNFVDIETFLCGYPPAPHNFSLFDSYFHDITNILESVSDFENINNVFLFNDPTYHSFSIKYKNYYEKLNSITKFKNSYVLIAFRSESYTGIYKLTCHKNAEKALNDSITCLNVKTTRSIIISEIVTKSNHWDSSIYSLLSSWTSRAFRFAKTSTSSIDILKFICNVLSGLEDRLASIVAAKILFPSFISCFNNENFYPLLWECADSKKNLQKLLKIAIFENISELLSKKNLSHYLHITKTSSPVQPQTKPSLVDHESPLIQKREPLSVPLAPKNEIQCIMPLSPIAANKLVEQIRRDQYLFGVEFNDPTINRLLNNQIERLNRTLKHLSADLYSDKLHFIREIFQNMDDSFTRCNHIEEPTVAWIIDQKSLIILSNEIGLNSDDIRALCDIGNSSKKNQNFIGSKGIGFKSVFQITDRPEIHSNQFHICFDYTKYGPLGYVMPETISYNQETLDRYHNLLKGYGNFKWGTALILPFKNGLNTSVFAGEIFDTINHKLLLFLKNIQSCIVVNCRKPKINVFQKRVFENLISITFNNVSTQWIYLSKHFPANNSLTCEISLAFQLPEKMSVGTFSIARESLYCYLPINFFAFKFLINAPFELTSSREGILKGSEWNSSILFNIPSLFLEAVPLIKNHSLFKSCWLSVLASYLPSMNDYFESPFDYVSNGIIQSLRQFSFITCIDEKVYEPTNCIYISSDFLDFFNSNSSFFLTNTDIFSEIMGLKIIEEMESSLFDLHKGILLSLGIAYFCLETFVEFIAKWYHNPFYNQSLLTSHKIGIILGLMSILLNKESKSSTIQVLQHFSSLPIIPVGDTFESCYSSKIYIFGKDQQSDVSPLFISSNIKFLRLETINICKAVCGDENCVNNFFSLINIQIFDPFSTVNNLVEQFYSNKTRPISEQVQFLQYIANLWKDNSSMIDIAFIKKHSYISTFDNLIVSTRQKLYSPCRSLLELSRNFKCTSLLFIHNLFISNDILVEFLKELCLLEAFNLYDIQWEDLSASSLSLLELWEKCPTISSQKPADISSFFDRTNINVIEIIVNGDTAERLHLAHYLDNNWDLLYSTEKPSISSFFLLLENHPWLPNISMDKLSKPSRLFNQTEEISSFFSTQSQFLISAHKFKNQNLTNFLKIRLELYPNDLLVILKHWTTSSFTTNYTHISFIYKKLRNSISLNPSLLENFISKKIPLIFIPDKKILLNTDTHPSDILIGKFVFHFELFINEPIFNGEYLKYPPLNNVYKDVDVLNFFSSYLKIFEEPSFEAYLIMFSSQFIPSSDKKDKSNLVSILSKIGVRCLESNQALDSLRIDQYYGNIKDIYEVIKSKINEKRSILLRDTLKNIQCLPTHRGLLVAPSSTDLYICDDLSLREILYNLSELNFVEIQDSLFCHTFIDLSDHIIGMLSLGCSCGISLLSSSCCVSIDTNRSFNSYDSNWHNELCRTLPYLYSYLYCKYPRYSDKLSAKKIWETFQQTEFIEHQKSSITIYIKISKFKITTNMSGIFSSNDRFPVFHHLSCKFTREIITESCGSQIIEEFLKILYSPSPCLIQELSNFVKDIIFLSPERRLFFIRRFGFDQNIFQNYLDEYYNRVGFINGGDNPSTARIKYKVSYDKEVFGCGSNLQRITPVIQPRISSESFLESNDSSTLSTNSDNFIQISTNNHSTSYTDSVGRWGEAVINQMLKTKKYITSAVESIIEINWVNEMVESMLPYDFVIRVKNGEKEKNVFIEVKASSNPKSTMLDLSISELEFALHCKGNYHLYKVTPKSSKQSFELMKEDDCDIQIYTNLIHHLKKKTFRLVAIAR
ncbi:hypothetical protein HZS_5911 [Henneguya salminicola]|nr:hypothetical protein HZS_5911 [Henneguya salminicola]